MTEEIIENKQKFFNIWAPNYDCLLTTVIYQGIHRRLVNYLQLPLGAQVLDLGCGTGRLLNRLAEQFPDLKGMGIDLAGEMIKIARRQNQAKPRIIYLQGNATNLPCGPQQFDAVFNTISFLHYPEPELVLREIARVLKSGGYYYLVDSLPFLSISWGGHIPFSPGGLRLYTPEEREKLGVQAGLTCLGHDNLFYPVVLSTFVKV